MYDTLDEAKEYLEDLDIDLVDDLDFGGQKGVFDFVVRLKLKGEDGYTDIFSGTRKQCYELNFWFEQLCENHKKNVVPLDGNLESIMMKIYETCAKNMGYSLEFFIHILESTPNEQREEKFGDVFKQAISEVTGKSLDELSGSFVRFIE